MVGARAVQSRSYRLADDASAVTLVIDALAAAGWTKTDGEDWTLHWSTAVPPAAVYAKLEDGQLVNHLPGVGVLANKEQLAEIAAAVSRRLREQGGEAQLSVPRTYVMPRDYDALQLFAHEHPDTVWIQKPKAAARGEGVSLVEDVRWVETGSNWLVQEYLAAPHLIDGHKYTLRCYGLITALDPLTVYIFDDGFTKFASRPFKLEPGARADRFRHLTNPDVLARDESRGVSERNLTRPAYASVLRREGHDPQGLFERIDAMIVEAIAGARESLARASSLAGEHAGGCFELLGFDVLVDQGLRPWLLECNVSPSLSVEAEGATEAHRQEAQLKARLVGSLLEVLGLGTAGGDCGFERVLPQTGAGRPPAAMALPRPADIAACGGEAVALVPAPGVRSWTLDGSLVLHVPARNEVQLLDPLAAYLWTAWNEGLGPVEMAGELAESFPHAATRAHTDVWNALGYWVEAGLAVSAGKAQGDPPADAGALVPFVAWNRAHLYGVLGTTVSVLAADVRSERWIEAALAGMEVREPTAAVAAAIEILHENGVWTIVGPGARRPCVSLRQLGPAVREMLIGLATRRVAGAAVRGTVVEWEGDGSVLLTGAPDARAQLARACLAAGAQCLADDLVQFALDADGRAALAPWRISIEESLNANWYGPLPGVEDADGAVSVTASGTFSRYWSPPAPRPARAAVRPRVSVAISPGASGSAFGPLPVGPLDALKDLLAARTVSDAQIAAGPLNLAIALVGELRSFRSVAGDPARSVAVLRELLAADAAVDAVAPPR